MKLVSAVAGETEAACHRTAALFARTKMTDSLVSFYIGVAEQTDDGDSVAAGLSAALAALLRSQRDE